MSHAVAAKFPLFSPGSRGENSPADAVLADIAAAEKSLRQIAADHGTTLPALALWLESAQAQDRMAELSAGLAAATRLAALAHTHSAVAALDELITDYRAERTATSAAASSAPARPATDSNDPSNFRERMLAERRRGNIIRAATTLLRLTRIPSIAPSSRPRSHSSAPMPRAPQAAPPQAFPQTPPRAPSPPPSRPQSPAPTAPAPAPYVPPHRMHSFNACRGLHQAELDRLNRMAPAAKPRAAQPRAAQPRASRPPPSPSRPSPSRPSPSRPASLLAAAGSAGPPPGPAP